MDLSDKIKSGAKSLTRIAKNKLNGVDDKVDDQTKANRLAICNSCEHLNKFLKQCKQCGCFVTAKTMFKEESCPEGKWSSLG
jgi:hypothetical protein